MMVVRMKYLRFCKAWRQVKQKPHTNQDATWSSFSLNNLLHETEFHLRLGVRYCPSGKHSCVLLDWYRVDMSYMLWVRWVHSGSSHLQTV